MYCIILWEIINSNSNSNSNKYYMLSFEKWLWWKEKNALIDRGESFPGFICPVHSIFEETQEWFLEHMANTN